MARFREKVVKVLLAEAPYNYGIGNIIVPLGKTGITTALKMITK